MRIREIVHSHIPTLRPSSTVRDAIDKMDIYQFPALVICDDDLKVLGVVTEGDISRAVQSSGLMKIHQESALHFGTPDPTTISPDAEVSDALQVMLDSGITILPAVEDNRLLGLVLRIDLMQSMLLDT